MFNIYANKSMFYILFLFLFLFTGCDFNNQINDEYFEIGVITSLSNKGIASGEIVLDILNLTKNEINSNGGINGKQIKLVVEDGACSISGGKQAAQKLVDRGIKIIVGGVCSDETIGASKVTEPNKILLISPTSLSHEISNLGDYVFRITPNSISKSKLLAQEVYADGNRNILIINEHSKYTDSLRKSFVDEFKKLGGNISNEFSFDVLEDNLSENFFKVLKYDFDSIYVLDSSALSFKKTFSLLLNLKINSNNTNLYLTEFPLNDRMISNFGDLLSGSKISSFYIDKNDVDYINMNNKFNDKFKYNVLGSLPELFTITSYETLIILEKIIDGNCDNLDVECIKNKLYSYTGEKCIFHLVDFDEFGDRILSPSILVFNGTEYVFKNN